MDETHFTTHSARMKWYPKAVSSGTTKSSDSHFRPERINFEISRRKGHQSQLQRGWSKWTGRHNRRFTLILVKCPGIGYEGQVGILWQTWDCVYLELGVEICGECLSWWSQWTVHSQIWRIRICPTDASQLISDCRAFLRIFSVLSILLLNVQR